MNAGLIRALENLGYSDLIERVGDKVVVFKKRISTEETPICDFSKVSTEALYEAVTGKEWL